MHGLVQFSQLPDHGHVPETGEVMPRMKAAIFVEPGRIVLDEKPIPDVGPLDALIRITTTTICGTDVHILKGEYPVATGLTIGHEPVGVIEKLGSAVQGYSEGQRVIAGAITPERAQPRLACAAAIRRTAPARGMAGRRMGGWRFGNTIDGCQAEYVLVPDAMANLAPVPDDLTDEQVLMCPDIMSTGFAGAESGGDPDRRYRRGVRPGPDRPVRHRRRQADAAPPRSSGSTRCRERLADGAAAGRRPSSSTSRPATRSRRSCGSPTGAAWMSRSRRWARRQTFESVPARAAAGRHALQPGRLFERPHDPARAFRRRTRRPHDRHHALPRRQGAHAPADGRRRSRAASTSGRW